MERRVIIFFLMSFLVIFTMSQINRKLYPPPPPTAAGQLTTQTLAAQPAPAATATSQTLAAPRPAEAVAPGRPAVPSLTRASAPTVTLTTPVYAVTFSTKGAVPIQWDITSKDYVVPPVGESRDSMAKKGIKLAEPLIDPNLKDFDQLPCPFQTVLRESNTFYNNFNNDLYTTETLTSGSLTGYRFTSPPSASGVKLVKTYLFETKPGGFSGQFRIELVNNGKYNLTFDHEGAGLGVVLGPGLGRIPEDYNARITAVEAAIKGVNSAFAPRVSTPGEVVAFPGSEIEWGALQSHYFMEALIPRPPTAFTAGHVSLPSEIVGSLASVKTKGLYPSVELYTKAFTLDAGGRQAFQYDFYVGPMERKILLAADHNLTRALFFSSWEWMRALYFALMRMLVWFHGIFRNWGVAIIVLTIVVRILAFPLVQKGMKSQAKMMAEQARLKPLMDKINEKYKNDPQRKQQEVFKLYKEHGVNPFGAFKGCLWMMIQMPIFIGLYYVINNSIELRGAAFLWIADLSQPDRLVRLATELPLIHRDINILPVIMAATQILTAKFSTAQSAAADPQQAQMQQTMTYFMPVFMLFIFYSMPSGLVLYWTVSNIWQVLQQLWVNKHMPGLRRPAATPGTTIAKKA